MTVSIQGQFQRSVNLVRDFHGKGHLAGYVLTTKARELLGRIAESLETEPAQRAWSITGPYGGGKSAFALFVAHLFKGNDAALAHLREADEELASRFQQVLPGTFCPVLIVGSREPLGKSLLEGLASSLSAFLAQNSRPSKDALHDRSVLRESLSPIIEQAHSLVEHQEESSIIELYQRAAAVIHAATGGGLFLVIDELGKLLEYAAIYPDRTDLYLLQRLAERASRTGSRPKESAPLLVLTILHQAFDRYAGRLTAVQRDEWRKVQGRFEDFAFVEPVHETLRLLARAIVVSDEAILPEDAKDTVESVLQAVQFPQHIDPAQVRTSLLDALPLHPAVSLIVGPLFRRLAQNERSLFAFLASGEPEGFLDVVRRTSGSGEVPELFEEKRRLPYYRLDHLYDYLVGALGAALYHESLGKLWAETEAAISSLHQPSELAVRLVKQIALLSFAGSITGLRPTPEVLYATSGASRDDVDDALQRLREERVLTYRPFKAEYHVWQGSDFDLEEKLREARDHVHARMPIATMLSEVLPPMPIVARRHSYRTGTTRVFEVQYVSDVTWPSAIKKPHKNADGRILYVLPEHDSDTASLIEKLRTAPKDPLTVVAVPDGVATLREIVRELRCLEWVRRNAKELDGDPVARREVNEQFADLGSYVLQRLAELLVTDEEGRNPCTWIHCDEVFRLESERELQETLSRICDDVFGKSPEIWNELLNRRKPSPSAKRGLKLLLEAMIAHGDKPRLEIVGYPAEYGMYASVLQATGMHRPVNGEVEKWHFGKPDETKRPGCVAVWEKIDQLLRNAAGQRVDVIIFYETLSRPPYGVRAGLIPVFLFSFYKHAEDEIAIYENGTFVQQVDFETIERFLKSPGKFSLQLVEITGARAVVLQELAPLVGLPTTLQQPLPFVIRLLRHIHGLPPYVRRTASLSPMALAVRETLQNAVEPATLLFHELPEACGVESFLKHDDVKPESVQRYVEHLQKALRELIGAYDTLVSYIQQQIAQVFRLRAESAEDRRHELAERAQPLLSLASDTRLRAFLVRATDEVLDTQGWYESLAALLAKRPPAQWTDEDRQTFRTALREVARRFDMLEPVAFDEVNVESGLQESSGRRIIKRVRLSVTALHDDEREAVVSVHPEDHDLVQQVYRQLQKTMSDQDERVETKLAALAQLTLELIQERDRAYSSIDQVYE